VKRSRAVLLLVAVVAAAAGAFFVWKTRGPRPVRIAGTTLAADGRPLAEVRVTLEVAPDDTEEEGAVEKAETVSNEKGEFSIEYQPTGRLPRIAWTPGSRVTATFRSARRKP
jgi:hypothetical protein